MLDELTIKAIGAQLSAHDSSVLDDLRATLRIGVHWQAGVTLADAPENQTVTHALCSALPVAYNPFTGRYLGAICPFGIGGQL